MSFVVLGTDVLAGDALVVVASIGGVLSPTYTRRAADADLERYAVNDPARVEYAAQRIATLDRFYWPPITPFIGRLEHGRLAALRPPLCMTDEGLDWLATIAERDGLELDERTPTA